jgi:amidase
MSDVAFLPAVELTGMIRRRELGARELLEHYLERIERHADLNAVVTLDAEHALAAADAADRGEPAGPLHGLPITIKDQFETAGIRTTCGAPVWADHVPERDCDQVTRLKGAGAIVFGKTNLPKFAADLQCFNDLFGTTLNPWDPARTPGGSSGGSAAALAAGLTALELGGDIAGSIRFPASWCGVYGHKPSYGIVPSRGTLPAPPGSLVRPDMACTGPMARTAEDLELALPILAGASEWDAKAWRLELPPPRHASLADYRVAVWSDDPAYPVAAEVRERVEAAGDALERAGARVSREARPELELFDVVRLRHRLLDGIRSRSVDPEQLAAAAERARTAPPGRDDRGTRSDRGLTQLHRDWLLADERRTELRARWDAFFRDWDVLLCPAVQVPAILHDRRPEAERTFDLDGAEQIGRAHV